MRLRTLTLISTVTVAAAVGAALVAVHKSRDARIGIAKSGAPGLPGRSLPAHERSRLGGLIPDYSPGSVDIAQDGNASRLVNAPPPTCGGVSIAKASGGVWQCTFGDEFDGTTVDTTKWAVQTTSNSAYHSGSECFIDSANNLSVAGGYLTMTVRKESAPFTCNSPSGDYNTQYTSGMVTTLGKFSQAYGRFEVRAKLPAAPVKGLQESFWLWPVDSVKYGAYPNTGEIDFAEIFHHYPDRAIPYIHYNAATVDATVTNNYCMVSDIAQFHTYAVEWTTTEITIKYDDTACLVNAWNPASLVKPQPFDSPFFLALTVMLGIGDNLFDPTTTPLPAVTQVDYVRIWK